MPRVESASAGEAVGALAASATSALAAGNTEGDLWVGSRCDGLFLMEAGTIVRRFDAFNTEIPDSGIAALHRAPNGSLWIASRRGYLYSLAESGANPKISMHGDVPLVKSMPPGGRPMAGSANGDVWFAARSGGVAVLRGDQIVAVYKNEINDGDVTAIAVDDSGTIWITTKDQGAFQFVNDKFLPVSPDGLQGESFNDVWPEPEGGPVWFATDTGLRSLGGAGVEVPNITNAPAEGTGPANWIRGNHSGKAVAVFAKTAFAIGTAESLSFIKQLPREELLDAVVDPRGGFIFAAGATGILRFDETEWRSEEQAGASDARLSWRRAPVDKLVDEEAVPITIEAALANPRQQIGKRLMIRGRFQANSVTDSGDLRLVGESGRGRGIFPRIHTGWAAFLFANPDILHLGNTGLQEVYGFLEFGACYDNPNLSFQLVIVENHPVGWSDAQRAALIERLKTFCNAKPGGCAGN